MPASPLPVFAMATEHIVGDETGWTTGFDYAAWAKDKVFRVGDTLVFRYAPPNHNVIKVNASEFKDCVASKLSEPLISGNDTIPLATPGKKWYICGKVGAKRHCADLGQKLAINVISDAPAPSPSTPEDNAASGIISTGFPVIVAALVFMAMIMV
ncbi:hypothetical protein CUMW_048440, partial [Citrus unshiu]